MAISLPPIGALQSRGFAAEPTKARGQVLAAGAPRAPHSDGRGLAALGQGLASIGNTIKQSRQQENRKAAVERLLGVGAGARNDAMAQNGGPTNAAAGAMQQNPMDQMGIPPQAQQLLRGLYESGDYDSAFNVMGKFALAGGGDPFTLGEGQARYDANGRIIAQGPQKAVSANSAIGKLKTDLDAGLITPQQFQAAVNKLTTIEGGKPEDPFKNEKDLRAEFTKLTGDFTTVQTSFRNIVEAAASGDGPGDISLLTNYMKLLDPGSTVREGEFATAQNAQGVPDQIRTVYNRAIDGQMLSPNQRGRFVALSEKIFNGRLSEYQKTAETYRGLAENYGLSPGNVVYDRTTEIPVYAGAPSGEGLTPVASEPTPRLMPPPSQPAAAPVEASPMSGVPDGGIGDGTGKLGQWRQFEAMTPAAKFDFLNQNPEQAMEYLSGLSEEELTAIEQVQMQRARQ